MILDKEGLFSDAQAVTATAASTNIIDLGDAKDRGVGEPVYLYVIVDTAAASAGSSTVVFTLQTDDNAAFSSATALHATAAIPKATLVAGYEVLKIAIPSTTERYIRMYYTVAVADLTAGAFTAGLTPEIQTNSY